MPRFVGRPVTVEAHQYKGNTLNLEGAFNQAITRYQPGGQASVKYRGSVLPLNPDDWLVRGADGVVTPWTAAAFAALFEPAPTGENNVGQEPPRRGPGRPPGSGRSAQS